MTYNVFGGMLNLAQLNSTIVCTGECHVSPAVLAGMWREEEAKCKNLEDKMKAMLKGRGVCMFTD